MKAASGNIFEQVRMDITMFVMRVPYGEFSLDDVCRYFGYDVESRRMADKFLRQDVDEGDLERHPKRWGVFRKRVPELEPMDFKNADENPVDLWLPFHLSEKVWIHEGNIIIVAGAPNAGKTAVILNIIRENMDRWNVHLFDSESDAGELKGRLNKFIDLSIDQWNFDAYRRVDNFADAIFKGPGNLNVIDFLEIHDEFYAVGKALKDIKDALRGAVAVVGLQKNAGEHTGLGGNRMMEVARLVIGIDKGFPLNRCTITKAKHRKVEQSLDGCFCEFNLVNGCKFIPADKLSFRWMR